MQAILSRFSKPIVPLLIINSSLNQQKSVNLIKKLEKINYKNAKAIGIVIEIDNHMPVQIDKIAQQLNSIREQHKLKIYGFCHSKVSAESYYLLSLADKLFTMPSTVFQLQRGVKIHTADGIMTQLGIKKQVTKSDQNLLGAGIDQFTSANTAKYFNEKVSEINQRLYEQSAINRLQVVPNVTLSTDAPGALLGSEAIQQGYADQVGNYYETLRSLYPECELRHIRLRQKISTRTLQLLIASPIIIILFFFKVLLKYSIIMYLWLKHKQQE